MKITAGQFRAWITEFNNKKLNMKYRLECAEKIINLMVRSLKGAREEIVIIDTEIDFED